MSRPIDLPRLTLNYKTAGPLLRLLLAMRDQDDDVLEPHITWDTFKQFCKIIPDATRDVASFQGTWTPEDEAAAPDPPLFYCILSRELSSTDDTWPFGRAVQIQWAFDVPRNEVEEIELWSDSFPSLEAFFNVVEDSDAFRALLVYGSLGEVYTVDLDEPERG